jgi:hypothetical protein
MRSRISEDLSAGIGAVFLLTSALLIAIEKWCKKHFSFLTLIETKGFPDGHRGKYLVAIRDGK